MSDGILNNHLIIIKRNNVTPSSHTETFSRSNEHYVGDKGWEKTNGELNDSEYTSHWIFCLNPE